MAWIEGQPFVIRELDGTGEESKGKVNRVMSDRYGIHVFGLLFNLGRIHVAKEEADQGRVTLPDGHQYALLPLEADGQ